MSASTRSITRNDESCENLFDNLTMNISQAMVTALILERQPLVVDSQTVQQSRVQIVDVDRVLDDVVAVIIGFTHRDSRLDSAAR